MKALAARESVAVHEAYAEGYGYDVEATVASRLKDELVQRYVGATDRVLDVGCANGLYLRRVAPRCAEAVGVDFSPKMLELAARRLAQDGLRNVRLAQQNACALEASLGLFDVVYSYSLLVVVRDPIEALTGMAARLKAGGIGIFDLTGRYNVSQWYWRRYYARQAHPFYHAFSYRAVRGLMSRLGFDILEAHATGLTDQWRYLPLVRYLRFLDPLCHGSGARDWDYRLSNLPGLFALANRWYVVCRKR